jgi:GNAT superfamily N-acetyltransferase
MEISRGTLQDVTALSVLFDDYRKFYGKTADLENAERFLRERIKNNESVVFLSKSADNDLTGFVQLYPVFSSTRMTRLWLLNDLFVAPAFRGMGVSVALIEAAKVFSKHTASCGLLLETDKANVVANSLYLKTGFKIDHGHNYYVWNE